MKIAIIIVVVMLLVAWTFALPWLILLSVNTLWPNAVVINQWTYLATLFLLLLVGGMVKGSNS
jgi:hypothetical protein